jgi:hypothetical protein
MFYSNYQFIKISSKSTSSSQASQMMTLKDFFQSQSQTFGPALNKDLNKNEVPTWTQATSIVSSSSNDAVAFREIRRYQWHGCRRRLGRLIGQNSCCAECDDDSNSEIFEFSEKKNDNTSTVNVPERDVLYSAFEETEDSKVFAAR